MPSNIVRIVLSSLALTAILGLPKASRADEIPWSTDIEGSLREAAASGKPVLMEFTASWCVYCKRMEKTTFTDPVVAAHIKEHFVSVRVDADKHKDLVSDLSIKGLPAILIVSSDLQIIERISGFQTPEALIGKLDRVTAAGNQAAPTAKVAGAANSRPEIARSPSENRQELTFEPITHEEATPKRPSGSIRPVSKPAAITRHEVQNPDSTQQPDASASLSKTDFFRTITSNSDSDTAPVKPDAANQEPAFRGSCLVSAVKDREILPGEAQFQVTYRGHVLYFRSQEHKQQFLAQPANYWPMLDGCCPMTLLDGNKRVEGELKYAAVFRKRIWLFASMKHMQDFFADPAEIVEEIAEQYPSP